MADGAVRIPRGVAPPTQGSVHVGHIVHLGVQDRIRDSGSTVQLQQGRATAGVRESARLEHPVGLRLDLHLCLVALILRDSDGVRDFVHCHWLRGRGSVVLIVNSQHDWQVARLPTRCLARCSECGLILLELLRHEDLVELASTVGSQLLLRTHVIDGTLFIRGEQTHGALPTLALVRQCGLDEVVALLVERLQEGSPLLRLGQVQQGRVQLPWGGIHKAPAGGCGQPMVHGRVGHALVLLPHPLGERLGSGVLVPEGPLGSRALAQDLHAAGRSADQERDIADEAVDALVEEVVAAGVLPAAPIGRDGDLRGELHLVGDLQVDVLTSPDHGVQVAGSAGLHTHTVVVVGAVRHVRCEPGEHKVVPIGRGIHEGLLLLASDVGVDHVGKAVVHADDDARVRRGVLQVKAQVTWRVCAEVDVVAEAKVPERVEHLDPDSCPHHGRPGQDVQGPSLRRKLVVDLHGYWRVTTRHEVPIHDLNEQVSVLATGTLPSLHSSVFRATVLPDARHCVDRALRRHHPGCVNVGAKLAGVDAAEAPCVLRLGLRRTSVGRVPMHCQFAVLSPHVAVRVTPAMVQGVQPDQAAVLPDGDDPGPRSETGNTRARHPVASVHAENVTSGCRIGLRAAGQALVLQIAARAVVNALREGDGVAEAVVALWEGDQVLHGVKAHGIHVAHLVVKLPRLGHDSAWLAQDGTIHIDEQRVAPAIAIDLQTLLQACAVSDGRTKVNDGLRIHVGECRRCDEHRVHVEVAHVAWRLLAEAEGLAALVLVEAHKLDPLHFRHEPKSHTGVAERLELRAHVPPIRSAGLSELGGVDLRVGHADPVAGGHCVDLGVLDREDDPGRVVILRVWAACHVHEADVAVSELHAACDAAGGTICFSEAHASVATERHVVGDARLHAARPHGNAIVLPWSVDHVVLEGR
mmetsp:Transcript_99079/g.222003  ORF Transcript_99079/g.222003 Transcript_99079/m.222003 type:complete len:921 (-) Transcript_99079:1338-4100(-)